VPISAPKDLIACRQFFLESTHPKQRQYEALRAYFVEGRSSPDAAKTFGYSVGSFRVLCHHFRREAHPEFFLTPQHGPQTQPQKSAARDTIIALRKQNYSVYEISETLQEQGTRLSPTGVREMLKAEGFGAVPPRPHPEQTTQTAAVPGSRRRCARVLARPAPVHDPLRRVVPLRAGSGPAATGADRDGGPVAQLEDDSGGARVAGESGAEAVVH
jgi:transposase